tara:strand:- start:54 stop:902 length:849 start_codon:yes stop_codon:yes gene_type:complete
MRYANLNGVTVEASINAPRRAFCHACKESVFLRCPVIVVPHWVHHSGSECVHAGKTAPETDWHKHWKGTVPETYREVSIRKNGKLRRADIRAATRTVIELQHSSIADDEVDSREEFYGPNMFWLFDSDGRTRRISRLRAGIRVTPPVAGMNVYECEVQEKIPGLFDAKRAKLVDLGAEVIRIIPHAANSFRHFLCCVQPSERVRDQFGKTCDSETPYISPFLLNVSPDWATKKLQAATRKAVIQSSGQYMTDYCPRGYMPQKKYTEHLSPDAWADIMRGDNQ